jgi:hypothetical protein
MPEASGIRIDEQSHGMNAGPEAAYRVPVLNIILKIGFFCDRV